MWLWILYYNTARTLWYKLHKKSKETALLNDDDDDDDDADDEDNDNHHYHDCMLLSFSSRLVTCVKYITKMSDVLPVLVRCLVATPCCGLCTHMAIGQSLSRVRCGSKSGSGSGIEG